MARNMMKGPTTTNMWSLLAALTTITALVEGWTTTTTTRPSFSLAPSALFQSTTVAAETEQDTTTAASSFNNKNNDKKNRISRTGHDVEAWKNGWMTCPEEVPPTLITLSDSEELPHDFPDGTYYRNGHARFESDDGLRVRHMFDGDGMTSAHTIDKKMHGNKKILFRNRFVRTAGYRRDKATGTMSAPGTFGTRVSGGLWRNIGQTNCKNVANTHCLYANNTLYALWEGANPYRLDPLTLKNDAIEEPTGTYLDGLLQPGETFAAHYRLDPVRDTVVAFGNQLDPVAGTTELTLHELDRKTMQSIGNQDYSAVFQGTGITHDFALTENWYVFSLPSASVNGMAALKALLGLGSFAAVVDFQESTHTQLVLIPRIHNINNSGAGMRVGEDPRIKIIDLPYHFSFHCANAYEDATGNVVVDMVLMDRAVTGADMATAPNQPIWESVDWDTDAVCAQYVRFTVDPVTQEMVEEPQTMTTRAPEFPSVPPQLSTRRHRYAYTVGAHRDFDNLESGSGPAGAILKIDTVTNDNNNNNNNVEAYAFEPHEFVGEPVFVPKVGADVTDPPQEDCGYLVLHVHNGRDLTTDWVVLDVEGRGALQRGPVTRVRLPTYIPYGLHGIFVEGLTFDDEQDNDE